MQTDALARRYARVLIQTAVDAGAEQAVAADLGLVDRTIADSYELRAFVRSPCYGTALKRAAMEDLFGGKICATALDGIRLIIARGRERLLPDIIRAYGELLDERENRVRANLSSAFPLEQGALDRVRILLSKRLGKEICLDVTTNRALIGGCVLRIGTRVLDNSVRGRLLDIRDRMMQANQQG